MLPAAARDHRASDQSDQVHIEADQGHQQVEFSQPLLLKRDP